MKALECKYPPYQVQKNVYYFSRYHRAFGRHKGFRFPCTHGFVTTKDQTVIINFASFPVHDHGNRMLLVTWVFSAPILFYNLPVSFGFFVRAGTQHLQKVSMTSGSSDACDGDGKVVIVGSINQDLTAYAPSLPAREYFVFILIANFIFNLRN